jgi:hypothetical protein
MAYQGLGFIEADQRNWPGSWACKCPKTSAARKSAQRDAQLQEQRKTLAEVMAQAADAYAAGA